MKDNFATICKTFTAVCVLSIMFFMLRFINLPKVVEFYIPIVFVLFAFFILLAGVICSIIIVVSLFRKNKPNRVAVVFTTALPSFIITSVITFFLLSILPIPQRPLPTGSDLKKFNSTIWKMESSVKWEGISEREKMLKDLVENILPGKSKSELIELLGEPLDTPYFSSIDKDMIYYLGPERDNFINIDSEWLLIWLDEKWHFEKYRILND